MAEALWSPDGEWFIHRTSTNVRGAGDLPGRRQGVDSASVPLAATGFTELAPAVSPDWRWLAYSSTETGRNEIFVVPFPNAGDTKWPVSNGGGTEPVLSRDSRELFYRNRQGEFGRGERRAPAGLVGGTDEVLVPATAYVANGVHRYDVSPDGARFLMIRRNGADGRGRLIPRAELLRGVEDARARLRGRFRMARRPRTQPGHGHGRSRCNSTASLP